MGGGAWWFVVVVCCGLDCCLYRMVLQGFRVATVVDVWCGWFRRTALCGRLGVVLVVVRLWLLLAFAVGGVGYLGLAMGYLVVEGLF